MCGESSASAADPSECIYGIEAVNLARHKPLFSSPVHSRSCVVTFDGCVVPRENVLGTVGGGAYLPMGRGEGWSERPGQHMSHG